MKSRFKAYCCAEASSSLRTRLPPSTSQCPFLSGGNVKEDRFRAPFQKLTDVDRAGALEHRANTLGAPSRRPQGAQGPPEFRASDARRADLFRVAQQQLRRSCDGLRQPLRSIPVPRTTQKTHRPRAWRLRHQHQPQPPARLRAYSNGLYNELWVLAAHSNEAPRHVEGRANRGGQMRGFNAKSTAGTHTARRSPPPSWRLARRRLRKTTPVAARSIRGHSETSGARNGRGRTAATPPQRKSRASSPNLRPWCPRRRRAGGGD